MRCVYCGLYSNCHCSPAFCLFFTFCSICLGHPSSHLLGMSCPHGFALMLFYSLCCPEYVYPFPVWCLGQCREFNCIGSWSFVFSSTLHRSLLSIDTALCLYPRSHTVKMSKMHPVKYVVKLVWKLIYIYIYIYFFFFFFFFLSFFFFLPSRSRTHIRSAN